MNNFKKCPDSIFYGEMTDVYLRKHKDGGRCKSVLKDENTGYEHIIGCIRLCLRNKVDRQGFVLMKYLARLDEYKRIYFIRGGKGFSLAHYMKFSRY